MWNPDRAPQLSFEKLAKRVGLIKARAIFARHAERLRIANHQAAQQEQRAAAARQRRGPNVVRNDFDFFPEYHITPLTFKQLHRSTLGQRGCKGGEVFEDEGYMRDFLKKHPECAPQKRVTGDIRSGWTRALELAAAAGRAARVQSFAETSLRLQRAAAEGRARNPLIAA